MPKRDDKHSMAKDYLARIKWKGEHPYMADGSKPDIPNWKYKPSGPTRSSMSPTSRIILTTLLLIFLGGLLYLAIFHKEEDVRCVSGSLIFFGLFIFFAIRDASKRKHLSNK